MRLKLMEHQRRWLDIAAEHPRFGLFAEPGLGKTISVLAAIDAAKANGFRWATVVVAPKSILDAAWVADGEYFPRLKVVNYWANSAAKRRRTIETCGADVMVLNFETFKNHRRDLWKAGVRRLVIDESSKVKSPATQISKACHEFSDHMESVWLLSGTPAPNDSTEYWSQMRCIDPEVFGRNFWRFANSYFFPKKITVAGKERIVGWKSIPLKEPEFLEKLSSRSISLRKEDCLDLPEQTDIIRPVDLSKPEVAAYASALTELQIDLQDGRTLNINANAKVMKLRQLTGGAFYEGAETHRVGHAKLEELSDLLEEIGRRQVLIWAQFTSEIDAICERLGRADRDFAIIDGRTQMADRTGAIEAFQAGKLEALVLHPAAAGHGITLTAASHAIYFSHGFSFEHYQQSRDRIHRKGQTRPCTYWHLMATGTVDEAVMKALMRKRDAHDDVMAALGIQRQEAA